MYINNQQVYNSNGLHAHKSYTSNNFKRAIFEYKEVLVGKGYDYEECPYEIMELLLCEPFFTRRMKFFSGPAGLWLYCKLGIDFVSISELLYPNMCKLGYD